jgi:hypothetical protein
MEQIPLVLIDAWRMETLQVAIDAELSAASGMGSC